MSISTDRDLAWEKYSRDEAVAISNRYLKQRQEENYWYDRLCGIILIEAQQAITDRFFASHPHTELCVIDPIELKAVFDRRLQKYARLGMAKGGRSNV
jgi:hypothetical protein